MATQTQNTATHPLVWLAIGGGLVATGMLFVGGLILWFVWPKSPAAGGTQVAVERPAAGSAEARGGSAGTGCERPAAAAPAAAKAALELKPGDELGAADLDASIEMLAFMWVAAGRDAGYITPEAVYALRTGIARNFKQLPADLRRLFANATTIYGQMRTAWSQAVPEEQLALARGFGEALDAMGLTLPSAGGNGGGRSGGGSAWDDVNPDDIHAGLVVNTCWNLAQKATR